MLTSGRLINFDRNIAPLVAAGLISAAGSAAGAGINSASQAIANKKSWKYTQKAMKLQQQYALEQMQKQYELNMQANKEYFDYQNAYNEPSKIFERYMKAGINPAAVLGSSGVGVNATMSGSPSSTTSTPPGPNADFDWKPADFSMLGSGAASAGQLMLEGRRTESEVLRNKAAADRDSAEAARIDAQNVGREAYRTAFDLNNQLLESNIKDANARAKYNDAIAEWQLARNKYKDLIATAEWQQVEGELGLITEEYDRIKSLNQAEIPIMKQVAAANLAYLLASARSLRAGASVDEITAKDLQNWFKVNWETPIDVPEVDADGKPTGTTKKMTGSDIASYLLGIQYTEGAQGVAARSFENWQKKHPMLVGITERLAGGVSAAAAMRAGRGRSPRGSATTTYRVNRNGEVIGGTNVETRMIY